MFKKNSILFFFLITLSSLSYAQDGDKCNCPPIKLYVYDTKIDFPLDKNADGVEAGKYVEAQNSGDWLEGAYFKQQSDEFKVYKNLRPGATKGSTYELPPANGGNSDGDIDFTSYAEVSRLMDVDGSYSYTVALKIYDAQRHSLVQIFAKSTGDLGEVDDLIAEMIGGYSPVETQLRHYQEDVRDKSGKMWIGLKFKTTAEKTNLKLGETTKIHIKVFDCYDEKPAPNQQLQIKLTSSNVGTVSPAIIKTNSTGDAIVVFTAKNKGETEVIADFTYTAVNGKSGYHGTHCGDLQKINVEGDKYKVTMELDITGPDALHWQLKGEVITKLISYADGTFQLKPLDNTRNLPVHVLSASTEHMKLIGQYDYPIPFTLNIGNIRKSNSVQAKISFDTFSPSANGKNSSEPYQVPDHVLDFPGYTSHLVQGLFYDIEINVAKKSEAPEMIELAEMKKIQSHAKDPKYWQTPQGKADLLKMQKIMEERGRGDLFQNLNKPSKQSSNADKAFVKGMQGTQNNPSAYGAPDMPNTPSIMGNLLQFSGTFDNSSAMPLNILQEGNPGGGMKGTMIIKVQKVE